MYILFISGLFIFYVFEHVAGIAWVPFAFVVFESSIVSTFLPYLGVVLFRLNKDQSGTARVLSRL